MSKFFNADEEDDAPEQEEQPQVGAQQQASSQNKKKTKKDKKKKKKDDDFDILDEEIAKNQQFQQQNEQTTQVVTNQKEEAKPEPNQPPVQPPQQEKQKEPIEKEEDKQPQEEGEQQAEGGTAQKEDKKKKKKKKEAKEPTEKKETKKEDNKPRNAAAQRALELKKLKEEAELRQREEEDRLQKEEDERQRIEDEIEKKKKEEDDIKKLIKKNKIENLKKEGKYKSKKEKAEEYRQNQFRSQMLQSQGTEVQVEDKSNVVRRQKKKKNEENADQQQQQSQQEQQEGQDRESKVLEQQQQVQEQQQDEEEDWEKMYDQDAVQQQLQAKPQEEEQKVQQKDKAEEKKMTFQQETQKALSNKVNKELYAQYFQQSDIRSPICCILGHVDTGKTTLLDKIRNTNVQEGEAGGITQQIGATFFPGKKLQEEVSKCNSFYKVDCNVPGLLIIDTPGHESFSNLRSRGSSLCDLAILVVDLMHGIEKQTLESLELLKMRKTPFVIALNKIDRCFEWEKRPMASSYIQLQKQKSTTKGDYENRKKEIITQLQQQGFNVVEFWKNDDPKTYVSIIPTSGVTGEGIPDLLSVIVKYTSVFLKNKVKVKDQNNCTVLERKVIEGHGATIDCILVDGVLRTNDQIVIQGFSGPIVTNIKAILTPHPMKEMRVKGEYLRHDILYAAMGLKLAAPNLEDAVAGSQLFVANTEEQVIQAKQQLENDFDAIRNKIKLANLGVGVAASTLGSLEALTTFLEKSEIPVSYVSVGPVSKDDVMKALKNVLLENPANRKKEYACMLVFDVKVLADAKEFADQNQIKIFEANIIYHLFDSFIEYVKKLKDERRKELEKLAVFPCIFKPVAFFNKKDPIIMGVDVIRGVLKAGTPICVMNDEKLKIGTVESIESNHKQVKEARLANGSVAIRISGEKTITAGRHFQQEDSFTSIINRNSIDILKEYFRDDLTLEDWQLVKELKGFFNII